MTDSKDEAAEADMHLHRRKAALHVICLGSSGGPSEDGVTGLLVRSIDSDWTKGSLLAVDAGSHLAPIVRILERHFPTVSAAEEAMKSRSPSPEDEADEAAKPEPTILTDGPFAGLTFPNASARANALHILRNYVNTYLITHPHLDHLSGFTINTAAFHATSRPKTVAALPSTVDAIKQHIFNDIIWPNLTDEDGGVGFVTFQRLKEGGDLMIGEGEGRGYIEITDGLGVKPFKVSHGVCTKGPPSHHHRGSIPSLYESQPPYHGSIQGEPAANMSRNVSMSANGQFSNPGTPSIPARQSFYNSTVSSPHMAGVDHRPCVVDSTAYFIRDIETSREVLIFGDVEPDSMSMSPRTHYVWQEAAHKIAQGLLGGIFIECSYDDSQADAVLFGHLNPRHLIAELQNLAAMVVEAKIAQHNEKGSKKRKRSGPNGLEVSAKHAVGDSDRKRSRSLASRSALAKDDRRRSVPENSKTDDSSSQLASPSGPQTQHRHFHADPESPKSGQRHVVTSSGAAMPGLSDMPLRGIKIVIIHVKDTMKDGPHVKDNILAQLQGYEEQLHAEGHGMGCEFVISEDGESYWF